MLDTKGGGGGGGEGGGCLNPDITVTSKSFYVIHYNNGGYWT